LPAACDPPADGAAPDGGAVTAGNELTTGVCDVLAPGLIEQAATSTTVASAAAVRAAARR
jgi:hypothetical protein